jgi:hypothetical protein
MPRPRTDAAGYRKIMLRIPGAALEAAREIAVKEHRSLNAQLVYAIEEWLQSTQTTGDLHGPPSARKD